MTSIGALITCYNYGAFVGSALRSVATQTSIPDAVVVVDDGSSDDSLTIIRRAIRDFPCSVEIVTQRNHGQLGALASGSERLAGMDLTCLLDADDLWRPTHVERAKSEFQHGGIEVLFSQVEFVGEKSEPGSTVTATSSPFRLQEEAGDFPQDWLRTVFLRQWFGGPTSAITLRTDILAHLVASANLVDWRLRADDVVVFLSAANRLLRRRAPVDGRTVQYRVHKENGFAGRTISGQHIARRDLAVVGLLAPFRTMWGKMTPYERLLTFRTEALVILETLPEKDAWVTCDWVVEAAAHSLEEVTLFRAELARLRTVLAD